MERREDLFISCFDLFKNYLFGTLISSKNVLELRKIELTCLLEGNDNKITM